MAEALDMYGNRESASGSGDIGSGSGNPGGDTRWGLDVSPVVWISTLPVVVLIVLICGGCAWSKVRRARNRHQEQEMLGESLDRDRVNASDI